jgi:hypothetical protein
MLLFGMADVGVLKTPGSDPFRVRVPGSIPSLRMVRVGETPTDGHTKLKGCTMKRLAKYLGELLFIFRRAVNGGNSPI